MLTQDRDFTNIQIVKLRTIIIQVQTKNTQLQLENNILKEQLKEAKANVDKLEQDFRIKRGEIDYCCGR